MRRGRTRSVSKSCSPPKIQGPHWADADKIIDLNHKFRNSCPGSFKHDALHSMNTYIRLTLLFSEPSEINCEEAPTVHQHEYPS